MKYSDICKILNQEPELARLGFLNENIDEEREKIYQHIPELDACVQWLEPMEKIKSFNDYRNSYAIKHIVEQASGMYIPNGIAIVAAIHCGFKYERIRTNARFNIGERKVKKWLKENGYPA
jgi:hypothetical protein